jgi:hypothetical protein
MFSITIVLFYAIELLDMDVVEDLLVPLDKIINAETDFGPSLLTVMEVFKNIYFYLLNTNCVYIIRH